MSEMVKYFIRRRGSFGHQPEIFRVKQLMSYEYILFIMGSFSELGLSVVKPSTQKTDQNLKKKSMQKKIFFIGNCKL